MTSALVEAEIEPAPEKIRLHFSRYETLAEIYANKQAIEKAIATEKDNEIAQLKKRNRRLIITNTALTLGITAVAVSTIYFTIF